MAAYLAAYTAIVRDRCYWAADADKLRKHLDALQATLLRPGMAVWDHQGVAARLAWREVGGRGRPTLAQLRALP